MFNNNSNEKTYILIFNVINSTITIALIDGMINEKLNEEKKD